MESAGQSDTGHVIAVGGFVPALWHVTSHFFIGLGPAISADIDSELTFINSTGTAVFVGSNTTRIGLQSVIGGWF